MTKVDTPKQYTNTQSSHRDQQHKENRDAITKNKTTQHEEDIVDVPRDKNQGKNSPFNGLLFRQIIILCHETQNTKHKHKTQKSRPIFDQSSPRDQQKRSNTRTAQHEQQ